jgi:GDP-L-fucose synthase
MRKLIDSSRMRALGWRPAISLRAGIAQSYEDYLKRHG